MRASSAGSTSPATPDRTDAADQPTASASISGHDRAVRDTGRQGGDTGVAGARGVDRDQVPCRASRATTRPASAASSPSAPDGRDDRGGARGRAASPWPAQRSSMPVAAVSSAVFGLTTSGAGLERRPGARRRRHPRWSRRRPPARSGPAARRRRRGCPAAGCRTARPPARPTRDVPTRSRSRAHSASVTRGPGSLNSVASPVARETTETVRRDSAAIGSRDSGMPAAARSARSTAPVAPPARPVTSTSLAHGVQDARHVDALAARTLVDRAHPVALTRTHLVDAVGHVQGGVERHRQDRRCRHPRITDRVRPRG